MMEAMHSLVKALPEHQTCAFRAILEQLKYFAGVQIRNAASVAGNICTGSPISDLNPIYMACGAVFTTVGKGTPERQVHAVAVSKVMQRLIVSLTSVSAQALVVVREQATSPAARCAHHTGHMASTIRDDRQNGLMLLGC